MNPQHETLEPVEFVLRRIPEVRVIFADYESALIQILTGERPCQFRSSEHRLWLFARAFTAATSDAFADQATERSRAQTSRLCMLQDRLDRLERDLEQSRERGLVDRAVRAALEKELRSRDGFNRAELRLAAIVRDASMIAGQRGEVSR